MNGEAQQVAHGTSVSSLLGRMDCADGRGVAVAINSTVVRRSEWESRQLVDGDTVLLIHAAQGG